MLDKLGAVTHCCCVKRRTTTKSKSKSKKGKDPYLAVLGNARQTILAAYDDFNEIKPIIEYRLREKIICVYPALPYITDLTDRTRNEMWQIYMDAAAAGGFMVFICDTRKRVLRSYVFPVQKPETGRPESAFS